MITYKTGAQIEKMRKAGAVVFEALRAVKERIAPGVTTAQLDRVAEEVIRSFGAVPSFKGYGGFPASICASVDSEVVHGIPSDATVLKEGQIVSIDCGAILDGFQGDAARTYAVGAVSEAARRLMEVTRQSFWDGMAFARAGCRLGDLSSAIQSTCESSGYGVVRALCGHGIGRQMHEDPEVPNFGRPGHGIRLAAGMTIAVEPMIVEGSYQVVRHRNGWTYLTRDGGLAAHYENSLAITQGEPLILTIPSGTQEGDIP